MFLPNLPISFLIRFLKLTLMVSISIVESHASLQLRYVFYGDEGIELIGDESPGPRLRSSKGLKLPSMGSTIMGCPSRIGIACRFC